MNSTERPTAIHRFQAGQAGVEVFEDRQAAGRAASRDVADAIRARLAAAELAHIVFAAAPSQDDFLAELAREPDIAWNRLIAFHMDEYLGIDADHQASFRSYLCKHIFDPAGIAPTNRHLIPGESQGSPLRVCLDYEDLLRQNPLDIVCGGIGENGHLAFNDPPVADFLDPLWVKTVRLDEACRRQQVHDGCFASIKDVPTHAYTLTMPALLSASLVSIVVPGPRKAEAVFATINGPIHEACPASRLREHPGVRIYLDRDSADLLDLPI